MVTSRLGSIRGSMPPTARKERNPSLAPVITRPTSSRWASSTTRLASSLPHRRTPITLPNLSRYPSSTRGRRRERATSATWSSRPEGPSEPHRAAKLARMSMIRSFPRYNALTISLKVCPRWAKFLKWSNDAQAGERITTSPSWAVWEAASTACLKSSSMRMVG